MAMNDASLLAHLRARKVHAYAASFGEDLASRLIARYTSAGDVVLDPFAGAGTALLQARLLARSAIGIDIDPVACLISRVITTSYPMDEIAGLYQTVMKQLAIIESELSSAEFREATWKPGAPFSICEFTGTIPQRREVEFWFAPIQRAVLAILVALAKTNTHSGLRDVVELAISSAIIHKWPNTLSLARDIDHSRPHRVLRDDLCVSSQIEIFRRVFKGIVQTLQAINGRPECHTVSVEVIEGDTVELLQKLASESVDYVMTSPPYFNAIDYPRAHRFSQWWLWPEKEPLKRTKYVGLRAGGTKESSFEHCAALPTSCAEDVALMKEISPSAHAALCKYLEDIDAVIDGLIRVLKSGKPLTFVIANNCIRRVTIPVVRIVAELLERHGCIQIQIERREIRSSRRRYPYGLKGFRGLMESEYVICAVKPPV